MPQSLQLLMRSRRPSSTSSGRIMAIYHRLSLPRLWANPSNIFERMDLRIDHYGGLVKENLGLRGLDHECDGPVVDERHVHMFLECAFGDAYAEEYHEARAD